MATESHSVLIFLQGKQITMFSESKALKMKTLAVAGGAPSESSGRNPSVDFTTLSSSTFGRKVSDGELRRAGRLV